MGYDHIKYRLVDNHGIGRNKNETEKKKYHIFSLFYKGQ